MNKEEIEEYIWNLSLHGSRWLAEELYKLQQENQKLKKQLEKKYNEVLYEENTKLINQQKEFIEYLEDYIDVLKSQQESVEGLDSCEQYTLIALEEILNKYKEIIGGDK
mgnify:CR=1 FL=1